MANVKPASAVIVVNASIARIWRSMVAQDTRSSAVSKDGALGY